MKYGISGPKGGPSDCAQTTHKASCKRDYEREINYYREREKADSELLQAIKGHMKTDGLLCGEDGIMLLVGHLHCRLDNYKDTIESLIKEQEREAS